MRSQIDKPVIPFRRPNDIHVIPVHAETGERASLKDKAAILEIFKPGQRPGGALIDVVSGLGKKTKAPKRSLATQGLYRMVTILKQQIEGLHSPYSHVRNKL